MLRILHGRLLCKNVIALIEPSHYIACYQHSHNPTVYRRNNIECNLYSHQIRKYAKGRDIKKDKSKKGQKVSINVEQLSEVVDVDKLKNNMTKCVDNLKEEFIKNLSLRSTTGAIDSLTIKFDGKDYELQELAQIVRKNPKTVVINMISFPQAIPNVLQALQKSGMNLNPQQDGTTLFIPVPKVTKEHRELLSKNAKSLFIKCRDSVKDIQNNTLRKIKKKDGLSQDLIFDVQVQINAISDTYINEAQKLLDAKKQELSGAKE